METQASLPNEYWLPRRRLATKKLSPNCAAATRAYLTASELLRNREDAEDNLQKRFG